MPFKNNLAAIILSGGNSSRMGNDKGLTNFQGRPLVTYMIEAVRNAGIREIMIITSHKDYLPFGYPCYPDLHTGKGPLAGICAGLNHSGSQKNLVLACDMPFVSAELINALFRHLGNEQVLLSRHLGKAEPLCSIYDKTCLTHFENKLLNNELKITEALKGLRIRDIQFDDEPWFQGHEFANMNTPDDLTKRNHQYGNSH